MTGGAWTTLDRIISVTDDEAEAIRNVPNTLAIFDSHFPRFPVLPGVLILGSLGTLCEELLQRRTGRAWRLSGAERVAFRHFVQPGDQLVFKVTLKELGDEEATFSGDVSVDGEVVTRARLLRAVPTEGA
jgi:3-hydroxyacyl-[acyl-carrier-protein] dehydratase